MPDSFIQVPPDSTGKKTRTRNRTLGGNDVHETAVFQAALPTYYALVDASAFAANKHHISILNAAGSGVVVAIKKLFPINVQTAAVTGVVCRFDVKQITAHSGGSTATPVSVDSNNPALPVQVTVRTAATAVTESNLLYPLMVANEEIAAASTTSMPVLQAGLNWQPEGPEIQEVRLREGQGYTVKQITSSTVGSFAWLIVFTVDDS